MIITRIGTGGVVLVTDDIGLPGLVVVRFPAVLSVETNLSGVGTVPMSFMVIPLPGIATIAFLIVITMAIVFPVVATTMIVFLTIIFSAIAFLAVSSLSVTYVFIHLVSSEVVSVVIVIWM